MRVLGQGCRRPGVRLCQAAEAAPHSCILWTAADRPRCAHVSLPKAPAVSFHCARGGRPVPYGPFCPGRCPFHLNASSAVRRHNRSVRKCAFCFNLLPPINIRAPRHGPRRLRGWLAVSCVLYPPPPSLPSWLPSCRAAGRCSQMLFRLGQTDTRPPSCGSAVPHVAASSPPGSSATSSLARHWCACASGISSQASWLAGWLAVRLVSGLDAPDRGWQQQKTRKQNTYCY